MNVPSTAAATATVAADVTSNDPVGAATRDVSPSGDYECEATKAPSSELKSSCAVPPAESSDDVYPRAVKYLAKHDIAQLFQNLTAEIVCQKPNNVVQFLLEAVKDKLAKDAERNKPK
jgi:hypothetical protein